jgi:hypothetical protein
MKSWLESKIDYIEHSVKMIPGSWITDRKLTAYKPVRFPGGISLDEIRSICIQLEAPEVILDYYERNKEFVTCFIYGHESSRKKVYFGFHSDEPQRWVNKPLSYLAFEWSGNKVSTKRYEAFEYFQNSDGKSPIIDEIFQASLGHNDKSALNVSVGLKLQKSVIDFIPTQLRQVIHTMLSQEYSDYNAGAFICTQENSPKDALALYLGERPKKISSLLHHICEMCSCLDISPVWPYGFMDSTLTNFSFGQNVDDRPFITLYYVMNTSNY